MKKIFYILLLIILLFLSSCSINRFAVRIVAGALTGGGGSSVFTTDDDPEFIADALPFALKTFESLLQTDPENIGLIEATAGGYVSYANAFLQAPAELLEYEQLEQKEHLLKRAAAMYHRGGTFASEGLELLHPGFDTEFSGGNWRNALGDLKAEAVPFLYWKAAAMLGEFSIDTFNPGLMIEIPGAVALAVRALELEEDYNSGSIHDLLISVFGNLPVSLVYRTTEDEGEYSVMQVLGIYYEQKGYTFKEMTVDDQVMFHLESSVKLSDGAKASPYVSSTSVYIKNQDHEGFKTILQKALDIDPDLNPDYRLVNVISQRKAQWLIAHIEDYFFMP